MITYPLNNIDYTAEDAELYFCTRKSGVHDENDFDISVTGVDSSVTIGTGIAWIRNSKFSGKVVALKEPETLSLSLPDAVYDRIDSIVIQFDANQNKSEIIVKEGNPSSVPVAPSVAQDESVYELHLYHILREAGSNVIRLSAVTDQRKNPDYCGIMIDSVAAVDETLSKRGFAADAASVGIKLNEVKQSAAPAGYGLGKKTDTLPKVSTKEEVDALIYAGWYEYYNGNVQCCGYPGTQYGGILVVPSMHAYTQFFFCRNHYEGYLMRRYDGTAWKEWEWVNPPMLEGVEYRTTERYNGKPVYTKIINCGNFPSLSEKKVTHNIADIEQIISCQGFSSYYGLSLPYFSGAEVNGQAVATVSASKNSVAVNCTISDWINYPCYTILKYTKTTD